MTKIKPDGTETKPFVSHPPGSNVTLNIPKGPNGSNTTNVASDPSNLKALLKPDVLFSDEAGQFAINKKTLNTVFKDPGEIFRAKFKKENLYILKRLGFEERENSRWYHPVLGEDWQHNWLWFNIETTDPESITAMLYKTGFVTGQGYIRRGIKKLLDL
jgi:hypothetical protein